MVKTSDRCLGVGDFVAHNCGRGGEDTDSSDAWTLLRQGGLWGTMDINLDVFGQSNA